MRHTARNALDAVKRIVPVRMATPAEKRWTTFPSILRVCWVEKAVEVAVDV
jgi:hypothetical protein